MKRLLIGLATLIPPVYLLAILTTPLKDVLSSDFLDPSSPDWVLYVIAFHFLMFLYYGLLLAYFVTHMFGNKNINREEKAVWIVLFLFFGFLSMPVYWFMRMKGER